MSNMTKKKLSSQKGMTMAELLTVVAIVIILAGVAFIVITNHQRTLAQQERDAVAKELFIAAQNHLTMAKGENYLGVLNDADNLEKNAGAKEKDPNGNYKGVHYIIYQHGMFEGNKGEEMFEQMLPFGSIDEMVRAGGNYVIRYQPSIGKVMDVFYCTEDASPERFNYTLSDTDYNATGGYGLLEVKNPESKDKRRNYTNRSVLGWYGGEDLETLHGGIEAPEIEVINDNTLYVESWLKGDYSNSDGITVRLLITGKTSGSQKYIDARSPSENATLNAAPTASNNSEPKSAKELFEAAGKGASGKKGIHEGTQNPNVVLDDITRKSDTGTDLHFATQFKENSTTQNPKTSFIPGEDIQIKAIAFSTTKLANIAESSIIETNSLFDSISYDPDEGSGTPTSSDVYTVGNTGETITIIGVNDGNTSDAKANTAYIRTFRHLENLDKKVSNFDAYDTGNKLDLTKAVQKDRDKQPKTGTNTDKERNLKWKEFIDNGHDDGQPQSDTVYYDVNLENVGADYSPTSHVDAKTYKPVELQSEFIYDGKNHAIIGVKVNETDASQNAGLFGELQSGNKVRNMELRSFDITSSGDGSNAGTLAGTLSGGTVLNVLARDAKPATGSDPESSKVTAGAGNAGGLIGRVSSTAPSTISYSAAAVEQVRGGTSAGGLIGVIETVSGDKKTKVSGCYSSGRTECGEYYKGHDDDFMRKPTAEAVYNVAAGINNGNIAGGLIGIAGDSKIENCYSTCSASGAVTGGFVGSSSGNIKNCYCTGLVTGELSVDANGTRTGSDNAFIGNRADSTTFSDCNYYSMVNEVPMIDANGKITSVEYKLSGGNTTKNDDGKTVDTEITPFDTGTRTYKSFSRKYITITENNTEKKVEKVAYPCDSFLLSHYSNGNSDDDKAIYYLKTVRELDPELPEGLKWEKMFVKEHYGDWPVPELFVIN